ncbi:TetR/AcrR family transcriptional regulator [Microbacterium halophytorum]|uniref:TetR/AcrR family transcriptional regulator n=1 Tax=Microbacterium halophytorum TaxID=2067568 RepID=UPI000CFD858D|nr:TetR/AcrR family transcriptional regulator [Microbacterium halophytorum]
MARTQAFDRGTAVRSARTVFWRTGYEGASIPALEHATGLSRSSIYNAFGSKRGLFDAAVESYLDEVIRPRLHPLREEPVAPEAIVAYLDGLRGAFTDAGSMVGQGGCLLVNTATAPLAQDAEVARVIADYRDELRDAIGHGVAAFLGDGARDESAVVAETITGLTIAAFALARVAPQQAGGLLDTARGVLTSARDRIPA